jgi:hypothetical protein
MQIFSMSLDLNVQSLRDVDTLKLPVVRDSSELSRNNIIGSYGGKPIPLGFPKWIPICLRTSTPVDLLDNDYLELYMRRVQSDFNNTVILSVATLWPASYSKRIMFLNECPLDLTHSTHTAPSVRPSY